jgi:hypothetical protein
MDQRRGPHGETENSDELLPVVGFDDEKAANEERDRLERLARETTSVAPFLFTIRPERVDELTAAIEAVGLPPLDLDSLGPPVLPERTARGGTRFTSATFEYRNKFEALLQSWWAAVAPSITPEANVKLWDVLFPEGYFELYTVRKVLWGKE